MTRQQRWAEGAYNKVKAMKGKPDEGKYATRCMRMPSLLLQSGLVQATAFLRGRGNEAGTTAFLNDFAAVLAEPKAVTGEALDSAARSADLNKYLRLSRDALQVATWFRRFAQSEFDAEKTNAGG
jgi:CRISPR-associated protein Cmr5